MSSEIPTEQQYEDEHWEKKWRVNSSKIEHIGEAAIKFTRREYSLRPALILDVDNGVDFSSRGMGLIGNRPEKSTK